MIKKLLNKVKGIDLSAKGVVKFVKSKGTKFVTKSMFETLKDYHEINAEVYEIPIDKCFTVVYIEGVKINLRFYKMVRDSDPVILKAMPDFESIVNDMADASESFSIVLNGIKMKTDNFERDLNRFESIMYNFMIGRGEGGNNSLTVTGHKEKPHIYLSNFTGDPFGLIIGEELSLSGIYEAMESTLVAAEKMADKMVGAAEE